MKYMACTRLFSVLLLVGVALILSALVSINNNLDALLINKSNNTESPIADEASPTANNKEEETVTSMQPRILPTEETCRSVFHSMGQGGGGTLSEADIQKRCKQARTYNVCQDLEDFTGLTYNETMLRLRRLGRYHFEGEHSFWNPQSKTELAWYYATSVDYLFANSIHPAPGDIDGLTKENGPVLDYSGGVGNNILHLTSKGIECQYFGIGMMEYSFAEFRVKKRGLEHLVTFKKPFSEASGWKFDPMVAPLPVNGSLGAILAMDVLEHIPDYHVVVERMVGALRVGGLIVEKTPFARGNAPQGEDLRVHLAARKPMDQAMGPKMKCISNCRGRGAKIWEKISDKE